MNQYNPKLSVDQRLSQLEKENAKLWRQLDQDRRVRQVQNDDPLYTRWAITTSAAGYPTTNANTFPIRFLDAHFTNAAGLRTFSHTARSASERTNAHAATGQYIPPGVPLPVFWKRGLGGEGKGEWWFLDPPRTYVVNLLTSLSYRSTATAEIWLPDAALDLFPSGITITVHDVGLRPGDVITPWDRHHRFRLVAHWYLTPADRSHWIVYPAICCGDEPQTSEQTSIETSGVQTSEPQTSEEQTSEEQTSQEFPLQTSTTGCDLADFNGEITFSDFMGGIGFSNSVLTVTRTQPGSCTGGYGTVISPAVGLNGTNPVDRMTVLSGGFEESYIISCKNINENNDWPGTSSPHIEWLADIRSYSVSGTQTLYFLVQVAETKGVRWSSITEPYWHYGAPGNLLILSKNPFHAIVNFQIPTFPAYDPPTGYVGCDPVSAEFTE